MSKDAIVADAGAAIVTIEFIAVANLVPAFSAFYGSIDELKHPPFRSSERPIHKKLVKEHHAIWTKAA